MADSLPVIPGVLMPEERARALRKQIRDLVGCSGYFVCEKSDGVRVLVYLTLNDEKNQEVFLMDRKNQFHQVQGFQFPNYEVPNQFLDKTIFDGELIFDMEENGSKTLKLLAFDLLSISGKNLTERPLTSRLGYLREHIMKPHKKLLHNNKMPVRSQPFVIEVKQMELSYGLEKVFQEVIPSLKHQSDGLIFTSAVAPYKTGTCDKMLKWKPAHENSVDFKLRVVSAGSSKPSFQLHQWVKRDDHEYFGEMGVTDKEWSQFVQNKVPLDGRIVEVVYDPTRGVTSPWKFMRFREDKFQGNHATTVAKIIRSINDGVTKEELLDHSSIVRAAWKLRETLKDQDAREKQQTQKRHEQRSRQEEKEEEFRPRKTPKSQQVATPALGIQVKSQGRREPYKPKVTSVQVPITTTQRRVSRPIEKPELIVARPLGPNDQSKLELPPLRPQKQQQPSPPHSDGSKPPSPKKASPPAQ
ncbi:hypothetical protein G9A89_009455 [Geosiphon pyriformis]|nr:hypothetical protein G9A89_009455 [Geosiphon pyriformis]